MDLQKLINEVLSNRELLKNETYTDAVRNVIEKVNEGREKLVQFFKQIGCDYHSPVNAVCITRDFRIPGKVIDKSVDDFLWDN